MSGCAARLAGQLTPLDGFGAGPPGSGARLVEVEPSIQDIMHAELGDISLHWAAGARGSAHLVTPHGRVTLVPGVAPGLSTMWRRLLRPLHPPRHR